MKTATILALTSLLSASFSCMASDLTLVGAYSIEGEKDIQPSGLTYCHSQLLAISDKHDKVIFSLKPNGDTYVASRYREFAPPDAPPGDYSWSYSIIDLVSAINTGSVFDWEDIACLNNQLFLLSESKANIYAVDQGKWMYTTSLYNQLYPAGFLGSYNAGLEALEITQNMLYVGMEREPRGIMSVHLKGGMSAIKALKDSPLPAKFAGARNHDLTALRVYGNSLYSLERNYSGICKRDLNTFESIHCWGFAYADNNPQYQYEDSKYGLAEGFVVHDRHIYVVFDSNSKPRKINKNDVRPLLFIYELPVDW